MKNLGPSDVEIYLVMSPDGKLKILILKRQYSQGQRFKIF